MNADVVAASTVERAGPDRQRCLMVRLESHRTALSSHTAGDVAVVVWLAVRDLVTSDQQSVSVQWLSPSDAVRCSEGVMTKSQIYIYNL